MIGDDEAEARERLDSIRARMTKFVCVNDNMMRPSERLVGTLQNFYLSFFPEVGGGGRSRARARSLSLSLLLALGDEA